MRHGRSDYDRIQDPEGLIGEDEPVFLLRAKDRAAPSAVRKWADFVKRMGGDTAMIEAALEHANRMDVWQREHGSQIPDAPPSALKDA